MRVYRIKTALQNSRAFRSKIIIKPPNEAPSFRPGGDEKGVGGISGGNKPATLVRSAARNNYK